MTERLARRKPKRASVLTVFSLMAWTTLQPVRPMLARDARVVHLPCPDDKRLDIQAKRLLTHRLTVPGWLRHRHRRCWGQHLRYPSHRHP